MSGCKSVLTMLYFPEVVTFFFLLILMRVTVTQSDRKKSSTMDFNYRLSRNVFMMPICEDDDYSLYETYNKTVIYCSDMCQIPTN